MAKHTVEELQTASKELAAKVEQINTLVKESEDLARKFGLSFELILKDHELGGHFNRGWEAYWRPSTC